MRKGQPYVPQTELAASLDRIGWSYSKLARDLGLAPQSVRPWHLGKNSRGNPSAAPADVMAYLRRVEAALGRIPVPRRNA